MVSPASDRRFPLPENLCPPPDGITDTILANEGDVLESLIQDFLNRYSDDPRASRLRAYQKDIDLYNLPRTFDRRVRGFASSDNLLPIEQEYLEAIRYLDLEPEWGATRLQALIDLYDRKGDASGPTGQCLTLARRRLARIHQEIDQYSQDQLALLQERLAEADALRTTNPKTAESVYRAVVELYDKKAWAHDAVRRAT